MSNNPDLLNNRLVDNQTGREVYCTSLTNFALAGWVNFQDSQYDATTKLRLVQDTPTKLTFTQPFLFSNFEREPQIGNVKYPIWDLVNNKYLSYDENLYGNNHTRLQFVSEAVTAATGVAIEVSLFIPTYLTIYRETKPLLKGTAPQRIVDNIDFYYDQNTIDNGCEIYLTAVGDDIDIYNINLYTKNW